MGFPRILAGLLLLAAAVSPAAAGEPTPDFAYVHTAEYAIEKDDDAYALSSRDEVRLVYLTERVTDFRTPGIKETFFSHVDRIEATHRGKKLDKKRIFVRYPAGTDEFFTETAVHTILLPEDIAVGDEVVYSWRTRFDDIAYAPLLEVPNVDRLDRWEVRFEHPEEVRVEFAFFQPRGEIGLVVERPTPELTVLRVDSLAWQRPLPYFPFDRLHACVLATFSAGERPLTPTALDDFAAWYAGMLEEKAEAPLDTIPELRARLDAAATELEKLAAIHDFVRGSIRYVSDAGRAHHILPAPPAVVLANRYGDCKDRAYLVQALARREGIEVFLALIDTRPRPRFEGQTSVGLYNHMLNACETADGLVFFDPTARYVPFGGLPEHVIGREALVLGPAGARRVLVSDPADDVALEIAIEARRDSLALGRAGLRLRDGYRYAAGEILAEQTALAAENRLAGLLTGGLYKLTLRNFGVLAQDDRVLELDAGADLSDFVVSSPTRDYLPRVPFGAVDADVLEREDDDLPLYFDRRQRIALRIDLAAPGALAVADSLRLGDAAHALFTASLTPAYGGHVSLEYRLQRADKVLAGEDKAAYLRFCRDYLGSKKTMFMLEREQP
jgi:transglutaminase-like putative cysteine protease